MRLTARTLSLLTATLVCAATSFGQQRLASLYTIQKLDYPGSPLSLPLGINNHRVVVGTYFDDNFLPHAFTWKAGMFTSFDYPSTAAAPVVGTSAGGINDRGDIAGTYIDWQGFQHGYTLARPAWCPAEADDLFPAGCKAVFKTVDVPGASQSLSFVSEFGPGLGTSAIGINNLGQLTGEYATSGEYSNGFVEQDGVFTHIDNPKASHAFGNGTKCFDASNNGIIACDYATQAYATAPVITHGFLQFGPETIAVDFPGSSKDGFGTQISGVNIFGMASGVYLDKTGFNGLLWIAGDYFTVNFPGMPYSELHSINDRGDVTGAYSPEPGGIALYGYIALAKY